MTTMPRVAVAGGSIGGLTAALTLRDIGCEVDIYERSSAKLESRGAGIAVLQETSRYLTQRMGLPLDAFCSSTSRLQFLNADGTVLHDQHHDYHFSAWNTIYRFLHTEFERIPDRYHLGSEVTSFVSDDDGVTVNFTSGDPLHVDLLVCADGIKSPARHALLPDVKSEYAGYVAWRGTVPEKDLSPETYDLLYDALTYQVLENSHILVYPIPDHDGATSPGHRLMNIVWYRNLTPNGDYEAAFTDTTGYVHDISLPPGAGRKEVLDEVRDFARAQLAPAIAEVVTSVDELFAQAVFDITVPHMAFDRVCIIGDAGSTARPHAAAGTAKAAEDGWSLAEEIERANGDVRTALPVWEARQLAVASQVAARARTVGTASQVNSTFGPDHPNLLFGLRGSGL